MESIYQSITHLGPFAAPVALTLFLLSSLVIIWRLERLSEQGVEGTVLGTLFMPLCSGMGNLVFALSLARAGGSGKDVIVNNVFNNITNLTLLIGLAIVLRPMTGIPKGKAAQREHRMGRLSLALNLFAILFFSLTLYLLTTDHVLGRSDGWILVMLFFFWQGFHLYDVKKTNLLKKQRYPKTLPLEVGVLLVGAFMIFISTDWLVNWFQTLDTQKLPPNVLGWASGILMVLPNALLAFYYAARNRMDVVYTSQAGDAHICIPLSIGLFALFSPTATGSFLQTSLFLLIGISAFHLFFIVFLGRLPKWAATLLIAAFGYFLWSGAV